VIVENPQVSWQRRSSARADGAGSRPTSSYDGVFPFVWQGVAQDINDDTNNQDSSMATPRFDSTRHTTGSSAESGGATCAWTVFGRFGPSICA